MISTRRSTKPRTRPRRFTTSTSSDLVGGEEQRRTKGQSFSSILLADLAQGYAIWPTTTAEAPDGTKITISAFRRRQAIWGYAACAPGGLAGARARRLSVLLCNLHLVHGPRRRQCRQLGRVRQLPLSRVTHPSFTRAIRNTITLVARHRWAEAVHRAWAGAAGEPAIRRPRHLPLIHDAALGDARIRRVPHLAGALPADRRRHQSPAHQELGIYTDIIDWLGQKSTAMPAVIIATVWRGFPFWFISFWRRCRRFGPISTRRRGRRRQCRGSGSGRSPFPASGRSFSSPRLLSSIWTANSFENIWLLTQGGPSDATMVFPGARLFGHANATARRGRRGLGGDGAGAGDPCHRGHDA